MNPIHVNWTLEQREWLKKIALLWKAGATQRSIAKELDLAEGTMHSRMRTMGVRFERNGLNLVFTATGEPVDFALLAA